MDRRITLRVSATLLVCATALSPGSSLSPAQAGATVVLPVFTLPVSFEPNQGQANNRVEFLARGNGYTLFLTPVGVVLASRLPARSGPGTAEVVRLHFVGGSLHPKIVGLSRLPGRVNYFIGDDPRRWRTDIPTYGRVEYRELYPGIDTVFHGSGGHLEYDWVLHPGADPRQIRLDITGERTLLLNRRGDLVLHGAGLELVQRKPIAYQQVGRALRPVSVRYALGPGRRIELRVGSYDPRRLLVVDPTLIYSTYLGGGNSDGAADIAVDAYGAAYVTGDTMSLDFPTANALQSRNVSDPSCTDVHGISGAACVDAFVSKLSPSGNALVYSTYLGGSLDEYGHGIAVDDEGSAYVTGNTTSRDFPTVRALQSRPGGGSDLGDAFVAKINPAGDALIYSTYLGGSGEDDGEAIAVYHKSAYVTGRTNSTNFPTSHAFQRSLGGGTCYYDFLSRGTARCFDAFVAKLNPAGTALEYSTYLGGKGTNFGWGIAVGDGKAYVAGESNASNFPLARPIQSSIGGGSCGHQGPTQPCADAFLSELNAAGSGLLFSTYLGGHGDDGANAVAVDRAGDAYLTGRTESANFPTVLPAQPTFVGRPDMAFVAKVDVATSKLVYSTYLGGSGSDEAYGVAVNTAGNAYVTGRTSSTNFPVVHALQKSIPGNEAPQNAFITELSSDGREFVYSTYLGGSDHDLGAGIALDAASNAYITGFATSTNFPTVHALQPALAGGTFDAFVAKIGKLPPR